ncbi:MULTISPECIES: acyl-CoA thioesterase [Brevundimonas]|uniref:Acyl-CoA thioesterase 2 n=1 Tax=Brevundimonas vancanneytii TaxID=1325724 RepID=A0A4P1KCM7_9CAUL|nr:MULTISPECIES: acyl-CoA thioesterase domain-containing protein [Brevundimonas]QBQ49571.1 acyl-CoA thioesterase II [Brevundimonas naejangsanensis]VTO17209.1 Acyl-CoA thioesterase 2 [Brevundimonas vancanneytii]
MTAPSAADRPAVAVGDILRLSRRDEQRFRATVFQRNHSQAVFGGCFLGQAMVAAQETAPGRPPSAMFARFLVGGDPDRPIDYLVETLRDGRSFSERRVTARQGDGPLAFEAMISFHAPEDGVAHQRPRSTAIDAPQSLPRLADLGHVYPSDIASAEAEGVGGLRAIDARLMRPLDYFTHPAEPRGRFWVRGVDAAPDTSGYAALAFLSDFMMPTAAMMPHTRSAFDGGFTTLSLNHAIWFHSPVQADDWFLHETESPWAGQARGLSFGRLYASSGALAASTSQELLIRRR